MNRIFVAAALAALPMIASTQTMRDEARASCENGILTLRFPEAVTQVSVPLTAIAKVCYRAA